MELVLLFDKHYLLECRCFFPYFYGISCTVCNLSLARFPIFLALIKWILFYFLIISSCLNAVLSFLIGIELVLVLANSRLLCFPSTLP